MLCQQIHRPADPAALARMLVLVDRLGCNMEPEAALVAYHGMNQ